MRHTQFAFRFWGRFPSLNRVKQTSAALLTSEAMLGCILVTQACPDLCTFPHTYIQLHPTSYTGLPTSQEVKKVPSLPASSGLFFPFPFLVLSPSLYTSLYRSHCILTLLVSGSFSSNSRFLVLTL